MKYFDLHCDTASECYKKGRGLFSNGLHVSLDKTEKYDRWAQVFAVWIDDDLRGEAAFRHFQAVSADFQKRLAAEAGRAPVFCRSGRELKSADAAGRNMALLSIENAAALGGSLSHLTEAREAGVRIMTLTWNGPNELGDGCMNPAAGGLSPFGKETVSEMGKLGVVADVSHLSEKGFWDVARLVKGPFIATHSDSKAVEDHPRNLTDSQFREIAQRGGLVGLNLYAPFIGGNGSIDGILRHAEHFLSLGGEKAVAIGADFDGCELCAEIRGTGDMDQLYRAMCKRFGKEIADGIFFENAFRFFTENLA